MLKQISSLVGLAMAMGAQADMFGVGLNGNMYRLNPWTGASTLVASTGISLRSLAVGPDGRIYAGTGTGVLIVNPANGQVSTLTGVGNFSGLAFVNSDLFAIEDLPTDQLVRIDADTGAKTVVGSTGMNQVSALAALPGGSTLYAWTYSQGLMTVNTATGALTDVNAGAGGFAANGMEFDANGILILTDSNQDTRTVDLATGATTFLASGAWSSLFGLAQLPPSYILMADDAVNDIMDIDSSTGVGTPWLSLGGIHEGGAYAPDGFTYWTIANSLHRRITGLGMAFNQGSFGFAVKGLAYRPGDGMYAIRGGATNQLVKVNLTNPSASIIVGNLGFNSVEGLACSPSGQLVAWDTAAGLLTVNFATGAATDVNTRFLGTTGIKSLDYTPDGRLIGLGNGLYRISSNGSFANCGGDGFSDVRAFALIPPNTTMYGVENGTNTHRIDRTNGSSVLLGPLGFGSNALTGVPSGDVFAANDAGQIVKVDRATGAGTVVATFPGNQFRGLTYTGGQFYGVRNTTTNDVLVRFTLSPPTVNTVLTLPTAGVQSLTASPDGVLFWTDVLTLRLYRCQPPYTNVVDVGPAPVLQTLEAGWDHVFFGGNTTTWRQVDPFLGGSTVLGTGTYTDIRGAGEVDHQASFAVHLTQFPFGDPTQEVLRVGIAHPGQPPLQTFTASVDSAGVVRFTTRLRGTYDIVVKGRHWLQKRERMDLDATATFFLTNGDLNDDNRIDSDDFDILVANFGFGPTGDLDGDDTVTSDDFDIIVASFGDVGDD